MGRTTASLAETAGGEQKTTDWRETGSGWGAWAAKQQQGQRLWWVACFHAWAACLHGPLACICPVCNLSFCLASRSCLELVSCAAHVQDKGRTGSYAALSFQLGP